MSYLEYCCMYEENVGTHTPYTPNKHVEVERGHLKSDFYTASWFYLVFCLGSIITEPVKKGITELVPASQDNQM